MRVKDKKKYLARKIVAERFRNFFAVLVEQLAHGTEKIWKNVENKLPAKKPDK